MKFALGHSVSRILPAFLVRPNAIEHQLFARAAQGSLKRDRPSSRFRFSSVEAIPLPFRVITEFSHGEDLSTFDRHGQTDWLALLENPGPCVGLGPTSKLLGGFLLGPPLPFPPADEVFKWSEGLRDIPQARFFCPSRWATNPIDPQNIETLERTMQADRFMRKPMFSVLPVSEDWTTCRDRHPRAAAWPGS